MSDDFKTLLAKVAGNTALTREESARAFDRMMSGEATPSQMGALLMALGAATQALWPWNKALWTPSFALWTGGVSCAALALWHVLVDRLRAPALGLCMGINAISAYALAWVATCVLEGTGAMAPLYQAVFVTPLGGVLPPEGLSALFAVAFTAVFWALMKGFQRMGWRISV